MSLEDHAGDVLFKARLAAGVSEADAARAAGVSEARLADYEEYGKNAGDIDLDGAAALLGLNADKLKAVADGWEPEAVDIGRWRQLRVVATERSMAVNCFLVWDEETKDAALFDTGWEAEPIHRIVDAEGLNLGHLFITHSHGDHIAALDAIRKGYPGIRVHSGSSAAPADQRVDPSETIAVGALTVSNRDTPGHADDGVTFVVEGFPDNAPTVAVVGDAIFAGSMGGHHRAPQLAREKVRDQILTLPPDALVCPGHGPLSTIREARDFIPFF